MNKLSDPLRKAAILIASLDEHSADAVLDQIGPEQAARVRNAVMQLEQIDPREQNRVIEEFLRVGPLVPSASLAGIELDGSLVQKFASSHAQRESGGAAPQALTTPPFGFLREAAGETLGKFLEREHPQTVAVVVSHLPPQLASNVLMRLPAERQADVLRRVTEMEETDPETVRELERELELLLSDQLQLAGNRTAGVAAVEAILRAADRGDRKDMLANLARCDQQLAARLGGANQDSHSSARPAQSADAPPATAGRPPAKSVVAGEQTQRLAEREPPVVLQFHDLTQLDNASLATVLRAADPQIALLALTGAERELVERILKQLPTREAKALSRQMEQLGPLRLRDVEQAQRQLARLAGQLASRGLIQPPKPRQFAMAA